VDSHTSPSVYGIKIAGSGPAIAPHKRDGGVVLSSVPFADPQMSMSSGYVFAGVPIGIEQELPYGTYTPRLSIANFSQHPININVYLATSLEDSRHAHKATTIPSSYDIIDTLTVPAMSTVEKIISPPVQEDGLRHSIVLDSTASPGSYAAKLVSRSDGALYQSEMLPKDLGDANNAGVHPWLADSSTQALVVLFNHTAAAQKVSVYVNTFPDTWSTIIIMSAHETKLININELIAKSIPDDRGHLVPIAKTHGVVDWMTPDSGTVAGRLIEADNESGMARSFSCGTYTGACGLTLDTLDPDIVVNQALEMYEAQAEICLFYSSLARCQSGSPTQGNPYFGWTVGSSNVIKLNSSADGSKAGPTLFGVAKGTGSATVQATAGSCSASGGGSPTVQVPTATRVVSTTYSGAPTGKYVCAPNQTGHERSVNKIVTDQNGADIVASGQSLPETITPVSGKNGLNLAVPGTGTGLTDASGEFGDNYGFCYTTCNGAASSTFTQTYTDEYQSESYSLTPDTLVYTCTNVTVDGN
jgi:hypothetical protein